MADPHVNCSFLEFCMYRAHLLGVELTFWAVAAEANATDVNGPLIDPEICAIKLENESSTCAKLPKELYTGQDAGENLRCGRVWPGTPACIESLRPVLTRLLAKDPSPPQVIELGAGMGLPGLWAAAQGACVTLTDTTPAVLELLRRNAELLLGDRHQCTVRELDWRALPGWLRAESYDIAIACDVLYAQAAVEPLLGAAAWALRPGGTLLLSHAERGILDFDDVLSCAAARGLAWTSQSEQVGQDAAAGREGGESSDDPVNDPVQVHTFVKEF